MVLFTGKQPRKLCQLLKIWYDILKVSYYALYNNLTTIEMPLCFHPSIFYTRLIRQSGCGGAGAYPSGHRARGGVHSGQVTSVFIPLFCFYVLFVQVYPLESRSLISIKDGKKKCFTKQSIVSENINRYKAISHLFAAKRSWNTSMFTFVLNQVSL